MFSGNFSLQPSQKLMGNLELDPNNWSMQMQRAIWHCSFYATAVAVKRERERDGRDWVYRCFFYIRMATCIAGFKQRNCPIEAPCYSRKRHDVWYR